MADSVAGAGSARAGGLCLVSAGGAGGSLGSPGRVCTDGAVCPAPLGAGVQSGPAPSVAKSRAVSCTVLMQMKHSVTGVQTDRRVGGWKAEAQPPSSPRAGGPAAVLAGACVR